MTFSSRTALVALLSTVSSSAGAQMVVRPAFAGGVSWAGGPALGGSFTFGSPAKRSQARAEFYLGDRDPVILTSLVVPKNLGSIQPYLIGGLGTGMDNVPHFAWAAGLGVRLPSALSAPVFLEARLL